jgi:hypothetical protein
MLKMDICSLKGSAMQRENACIKKKWKEAKVNGNRRKQGEEKISSPRSREMRHFVGVNLGLLLF